MLLINLTKMGFGSYHLQLVQKPPSEFEPFLGIATCSLQPAGTQQEIIGILREVPICGPMNAFKIFFLPERRLSHVSGLRDRAWVSL